MPLAEPGDYENYVALGKSAEELTQYKIEGKEVDIDGEKFALYVVPPSSESRKDEQQKPKYCVYCMGFGNTDPEEPNELSAHVLDRANEQGKTLIAPQFREIPKEMSPDIEAKLILKAMLQEHRIDLTTSDVEVLGFSDGGRVALELAHLIEKASADIDFGEDPPKRNLHLLSPTSTYDLLRGDITSAVRGEKFGYSFAKQAVYLSLEEIRLRLNNEILSEKSALEEAGGTVSDLNEAGNPKYPMLSLGFEPISDPEKAFDPKSVLEVVSSLGKLLSTPAGRQVFSENLASSKEQNIAFLMEVLQRAFSASPEVSLEDMKGEKLLRTLVLAAKSMTSLLKKLSYNELRSPACDALSTFDITGSFPVEDLVFPTDGLGAAMADLVKKQPTGLLYHRDPYLYEAMENAIRQKDYKYLGRMFLDHPDKFGRYLFPNAKSVNIEVVGRRGSLSGGHLAPLKQPSVYFGNSPE